VRNTPSRERDNEEKQDEKKATRVTPGGFLLS